MFAPAAVPQPPGGDGFTIIRVYDTEKNDELVGRIKISGSDLQVFTKKLYWYPARARTVTVVGVIKTVQMYRGADVTALQTHHVSDRFVSEFELRVPYSQGLSVFDGAVYRRFEKTVSARCLVDAACFYTAVIPIGIVSCTASGVVSGVAKLFQAKRYSSIAMPIAVTCMSVDVTLQALRGLHIVKPTRKWAAGCV
jgi:hypothetical protein